MEKVVQLENVYKSFNGKNTLDGINLSLYKNETIVLLGKSGGGKSVLLKTIVGLINSDEGVVKVLGQDIPKLKEAELISIRKKVGYVFQDGALYDFLSVGENVAFALKRQIHKKSSNEIKERVKIALNRVGLLDAINKMPDELSGGMRKRVALARTLILEPDIILYDEPTAALDPVTSKEIIKLIIEMKATYGISSIVATHDMICAKLTADKIVIIHNGKIGLEGSYEELESSDKEWARAFLYRR